MVAGLSSLSGAVVLLPLGAGFGLPVPNGALDERCEAGALVLAAAHLMGVDPQRELRVGVSELGHCRSIAVGSTGAYRRPMSDQPTERADPTAPVLPFAPRTRHLLMLEFGSREDFDDPRLEYRRLFSELLGTFALVLVAAGGGILVGKGQITLAAAVVAPGLMVLAIILFMGAISGAHLNPAVSLAFALRGDFPWKRVPGYIIIQLVGATLACLFLYAVFGNVEHLGATLPGPGYKDWQALQMEIVLTALLLNVILGTASAAQNVGAIAALGVGGYIALAGLWSAPVSGTSMNPARSFGPALVSGDFTSYWVYVVGPITGALIAVGCAYVLRGKGGDAIARAAGSGVLDEGSLAAKQQMSEDIDRGTVVPPGIADPDAQQ
ncbi:MAG: MIP/aquaporin family protein [Solirubrobacteraceae bacterium]